jgi:hypothetical protein
MVVVQSTDDVVASGKFGVAELFCSGMYLSAVTYNLVTDGNFTESVTFVGNDKKWITDNNDSQSLLLGTANQLGGAGSGVVNALASIFGSDTPQAAGGILRRQNLVTSAVTSSSGTFTTLIPGDIAGVNSVAVSGNSGPVDENTHIQSITISTDLGREAINELGTKAPYNRYVDFPVEITSEFEVIARGGDEVSAVGSQTTNQLTNRKVQIVLIDSTIIQLGNKNKLSNVSYGGGDAGGGNDTMTYSYSTFNDFVVLHSGDPLLGTGGVPDEDYWKEHFPL